MKWTCGNTHAIMSGTYKVAEDGIKYTTLDQWTHGPMTYDSFGAWLLCQIMCRSARLCRLVVALGFIDSDKEGGRAYWRWDPWNSNTLRAMRRSMAKT